MQYTIPVGDGETVEFECAADVVSRWMHGDILAGKTYPHLPFVDDVQVVFDVGANCGSASTHFARHHPAAQIHAFEPGSEQRAYLERNVARLPNVHVHPIGLHSADGEAPLYLGDGNTGLASLTRRSVNLDDSELVQLRAAGGWAAEHGIDRIDVLKVDVEGSEPEVLSSLAHLLPTVKVLYLEYDSREARRTMAELLSATHELYRGLVFLDQGECIYLRSDLADHPGANPRLLELFTAATNAAPP